MCNGQVVETDVYKLKVKNEKLQKLLTGDSRVIDRGFGIFVLDIR